MSRLAALLALILVCAAAPAGPAQARSGWTWPVDGRVLTGYSASTDQFAAGQHRGVDLQAPVGTPVLAATAGVVGFAGTVGSSGRTVSVRTADGHFDTSYLHLSAASVGAGERVEAGQRIGLTGTSGRPSNPVSHLHFGVRIAGSRHDYRDPLAFLTRTPAAPEVPHLGPAPEHLRHPQFAPRPPASVRFARLDRGWAVACLALIALAVLVGRSSIGAPCRTTSPRRSTTSTASPTWGTSIRPSPPTSSPGTCASAATTSSS